MKTIRIFLLYFLCTKYALVSREFFNAKYVYLKIILVNMRGYNLIIWFVSQEFIVVWYFLKTYETGNIFHVWGLAIIIRLIDLRMTRKVSLTCSLERRISLLFYSISTRPRNARGSLTIAWDILGEDRTKNFLRRTDVICHLQLCFGQRRRWCLSIFAENNKPGRKFIYHRGKIFMHIIEPILGP